MLKWRIGSTTLVVPDYTVGQTIPYSSGVRAIPDEVFADRLQGASTVGDRYYLGIACPQLKAFWVERHAQMVAEKRFPVLSGRDVVKTGSPVIGCGTHVHAQVYLGPNIHLGRWCVINTAATIEHDVYIGDFTFIGPKAAILGRVRIGAGCYVGAGSIILPGIEIPPGRFVPPGRVLKSSDVEHLHSYTRK
jgi:serine acetyltransferase